MSSTESSVGKTSIILLVHTFSKHLNICFTDEEVEWFISEPGEGWFDVNGAISNLIKIEDQNSIDDCKTACLATSDCVGFTFVGVISRCDLKNNLQAMTLDGGHHSSVVSGKWFTVLGKLLRDYVTVIQNGLV